MSITGENVHEVFEYRDGELYWKISKRGIKRRDKRAGTYQHGYTQIRYKKVHYYAHSIVWLMHHGELPELLDHIDGNRQNNRIENLRLATKSQNTAHATGLRVDNKSGFRGVWQKRNKWAAGIRHQGQKYDLGRFDSKEEAALAYDAAARRFFGEFAYQNVKATA